MSFVEPPAYQPMVGDPDDHRPNTTWALAADPGDSSGRVDSITVLFERCAPGDRIPLHVHETDEAVVLHAGSVEYVLGGSRRRVAAGATVFIPAGTPHGMLNDTDDVAVVTAIFPTTKLSFKYLASNPEPGRTGITNTEMQYLDPRAPA
ncbi:MAG: cupin domain-containing protein [Actinomycetota bacterium]|nr:cupin domain-containing protein [Actinomycetota bacterium]